MVGKGCNVASKKDGMISNMGEGHDRADPKRVIPIVNQELVFPMAL